MSGTADNHRKFFQQSTWMMTATVAGGVFMSLVHTLSKKVPDSEYALFGGTLLPLMTWMSMPAVGLQAAFARQTAGAVTPEKRAELAATFRAVMLATLVIWSVVAVGMGLCQNRVASMLKIGNPAALWLTMAAGLGMLCQPIVQGVLQGRESFGWLGWLAIFNGMGRLGFATAIVACGGAAAGIMTGTFLGLAIAVGTALWLIRDLWTEKSGPFEWRAWARAAIPLSAGCGVSLFMMSADPIVVQNHFDHAAPYIFGGTLARSIVILAAALTAVMFPKIARSLARGRKTDVVSVTLIGTLALGLVGTVGLRVGAPLAIKVLSKPEYVSFLPLIHWYALAMVPLALANVVINDMLARGKFRFIPWIVVLAAGYWLALQRFHGSFATVIAVLGGANLALLAVSVIFHQWEAARERSLFRRADKASQTTWSAPAP